MTSFYRGMDRASLDSAYNNVRADPDYHHRMAGFRERSDALYGAVTAKRDIAYGEWPRQRFDWLSCDQIAAPTFVFIHGGYWQNYTKEDLAFVAKAPLARGFNVILAEYTLAPDATMTEIVGEIRQLLDFLQDDGSDVSFGGRPVCLCGHSAGGQLAALHGSHSAVRLTLAISAIFDLEPIALSWLNDKLRLTHEEVNQYSPILQVGSETSTIVSVGEAELPELVRQRTAMWRHAKSKPPTSLFWRFQVGPTSRFSTIWLIPTARTCRRSLRRSLPVRPSALYERLQISLNIDKLVHGLLYGVTANST